VDLLIVPRRLGQTKANTTLDTYPHTVPGLQEKAAAIMDEITTPVALPADLTAPGLVSISRKITETFHFLDISPLKRYNLPCLTAWAAS